jgi:hypothetical protein
MEYLIELPPVETYSKPLTWLFKCEKCGFKIEMVATGKEEKVPVFECFGCNNILKGGF